MAVPSSTTDESRKMINNYSAAKGRHGATAEQTAKQQRRRQQHFSKKWNRVAPPPQNTTRSFSTSSSSSNRSFTCPTSLHRNEKQSHSPSHSNQRSYHRPAQNHKKQKRTTTQHLQHNKSQHRQQKKFQPQKYVALDCEMVGIGPNGQESALARVTLVNWNGTVLMDEFIIPNQPVADYRTFVSGITADDLKHATLDIVRARHMVQRMLQDKILVGHGLENDLKAIGLSHPWHSIRDTAYYPTFMNVGQGGSLWPRKLKHLVKEYLHREIQVVGKPHDPFEDAFSAMELYQMFRYQWEQALSMSIRPLQKKTDEPWKHPSHQPVSQVVH